MLSTITFMKPFNSFSITLQLRSFISCKDRWLFYSCFLLLWYSAQRNNILLSFWISDWYWLKWAVLNSSKIFEKGWSGDSKCFLMKSSFSWNWALSLRALCPVASACLTIWSPSTSCLCNAFYFSRSFRVIFFFCFNYPDCEGNWGSYPDYRLTYFWNYFELTVFIANLIDTSSVFLTRVSPNPTTLNSSKYCKHHFLSW